MSSFSFAWCMIKTTKFFVWTDSMLQYHNRLSSSNSCDAEKEEKEHFECCASFLINFLLLSQITEQYFRNQLTCLMDETNNFHILLCRFRSLYARGNNLTVQNLSIIFSACANLDWLCDRRIFFSCYLPCILLHRLKWAWHTGLNIAWTREKINFQMQKRSTQSAHAPE